MTTNQTIASHVIRELARQQLRGRVARLDTLATEIGVRREDVRRVVTSLHHEGHVDAKRMRLTMTGLVLAASMRRCKLARVRDDAASERLTQVA